MSGRRDAGRGGRLVVTNGDVAAARLREAGIGAVLPWRDALHEGPVPAVDDAALRLLRARFLAESVAPAAEATLLVELEDRDRALQAALFAGDEIVLLFESDLYDQLQLVQVLERTARAGAAWPRLRLAVVDRAPDGRFGLGGLAPERLAEQAAAARPLEPAAGGAARHVWAAFTAPEPSGLAALLEGDLSALPFLGDAVERLLEELPHPGDGLGRTDRLLLEPLAADAGTAEEAFALLQAAEARPFLGDAWAWLRLAWFAAGPRPLLAAVDGHPLGRRWDEAAARGFRTRRLVVTADGRAVLDGHLDAVALLGGRGSLGGTTLEGGRDVPRWDPRARRLEASPPGRHPAPGV